MPINIHISGENAGQALVELQQLAAKLTGVGQLVAAATGTAEQPKTETPAKAETPAKPASTKKPAAEKPAETKTEESKQETAKADAGATEDDVRTALMNVSKDKRYGSAKVMEVLGAFNVKKVSELSAEQRVAALAKCQELLK